MSSPSAPPSRRHCAVGPPSLDTTIPRGARREVDVVAGLDAAIGKPHPFRRASGSVSEAFGSPLLGPPPSACLLWPAPPSRPLQPIKRRPRSFAPRLSGVRPPARSRAARRTAGLAPCSASISPGAAATLFCRQPPSTRASLVLSSTNPCPPRKLSNLGPVHPSLRQDSTRPSTTMAAMLLAQQPVQITPHEATRKSART